MITWPSMTAAMAAGHDMTVEYEPGQPGEYRRAVETDPRTGWTREVHRCGDWELLSNGWHRCGRVFGDDQRCTMVYTVLRNEALEVREYVNVTQKRKVHST